MPATTEHAALPRRLGGFPFWRGDRPLLETLDPLDETAAFLGLEKLLGASD